jgi:hypothetical protein
MKHSRVKDLLLAYKAQDMGGVSKYLSDPELQIDPDSWVGKMKRLFDAHQYMSMEAEIASVTFILNLNNENGTENIGTNNSGQGSEN